MNGPQSPNSGFRAILPALLVALLLTGCDIFDEGQPSNARVIIQGPAGEAFSLVTSNDFAVVAGDDGEDRDVFIYSGDTAQVSAPFNQSYSLGSGVRFYLKAFSPSALSSPITVRVEIGGERRYNTTSNLDGLELEFFYTFR